ncbi:unnamed protein product [Rhizoctonia solani]|nr:unnamed protein product [Rhizoctonia solani]
MNTVESKRISDTIDQALRAEKAVRDMTRQKQRKILVLGQSESGKSTLIKQFRLLHSAETFSAERQSWKSIVYLNIIRSIWKVIEILSSHFNFTNPTDVESQNLARLRLRLMPLRSVELSIVKSLSSPREIVQTWSSGPKNGRGSPGIGTNKEYECEDVVVHPDSIWQRLRQRCSYNTSTSKAGTSLTIEHEEVRETDDPSRTLEVCATDMKKLWSCPVARQCLKQTGLFIEEISGFFLNDIERITSPGYIPTDDDILRTRVKTIRPTETILTCRESGVEWKILDSLVVMAPVSAFDQVLSEDPSVNRLKDSFDMWRELCNTTILHKIPVLLFLNKIDLLEKKLHEGVKLSKYLVSYGDRPNDFKSVLQCRL